MNRTENLIIHLDDHAIYLDGLKRGILSKLPPHIYHDFGEPASALSFIKSCHQQRRPIDVIITDFNHPGMNGFHFAEQIRMSEMRHGLNRTPIVMITMMGSDHELIQEGLRTKLLSKYFPKNASGEELFDYLNGLPAVNVPLEISLKDAVLNLNTRHPCWVRWIFSSSIYQHILEGTPSVEAGEEAAAFLKNVADRLGHCEHFYVHDENKIGTEILPIRGNVALIDDAYRHGNIIWFDDGTFDAMTSLSNIIDKIHFDNITVGYEF